MSKGARRRAIRLWIPIARRALLASCLWPLGVAAMADTVVSARFGAPTDRYAHGVLGDAIEYGTLIVTLASGVSRSFTLPDALVFEDTAPRLADIDGDGHPEIIVVESHQNEGARLAVFDEQGRIATTPYIGTRFRWLAPLGAADLDGDGHVEIAYVDRPHLAKTLRIWRFDGGDLTEVAVFPGVTNHRIGEEDIAGGIRFCDGAPEMILADAAWQSLLALRFDGTNITLRQVGIDTSRAAFADAMGCTGD